MSSRGAIITCKHVLPLMRAQRTGVIITISSVAAWEQYPNVAYKATKAGMIAFTQQVAIQNAEFGTRANVILPGLIDTPMAVDTRARVTGKSRAEVAAARDVPLRHKMAPLGTSQTPRCFWRPMRRISLPALRCRSMAAPSSRSIEPQLRGVATTPIGQRRPPDRTPRRQAPRGSLLVSTTV
jgi:NAD(P)-dependent dehydrogenase (short-subunit alcohol dehydrogenase family)